MLKFFYEKYYIIFIITVVLFVLNLVKEKLTGYAFNPGYYGITLIRNTLIYSFFISCVFVFFLSIIMLFDQENNNVNRIILIVVPLLIGIFFLLLMAVFGIKNVFPFH